MSEHTPGPWVIDEGGGFFKIRAEDAMLCHVHLFAEFGEDEAATANARLIAAAPDLLEALAEFSIKNCSHCEATGREPRAREDACHICGGCGEVFTGGWPPMVRAAIAKADGE